MRTAVVPEVKVFYAMPDEKDKTQDGWRMPEPVFRTSEGRSIGADADPESDIPTEQADRDLADTLPGPQTVRPKPNRKVRHLNKRRKSFWERNAAGLIVIGVFLLGALIYLAWLYRGKIL